jgi:hypothetical protein
MQPAVIRLGSCQQQTGWRSSHSPPGLTPGLGCRDRQTRQVSAPPAHWCATSHSVLGDALAAVMPSRCQPSPHAGPHLARPAALTLGDGEGEGEGEAEATQGPTRRTRRLLRSVKMKLPLGMNTCPVERKRLRSLAGQWADDGAPSCFTILWRGISAPHGWPSPKHTIFLGQWSLAAVAGPPSPS